MGFFSKVFKTRQTAELSDILIAGDGDLVDIDLPITDVLDGSNAVASFTVQGKYQGETIGFIFDLFEKWDPQEVEGTDLIFLWGRAQFRSLGAKSNRFLEVLAELYDLAAQGSMTRAVEVMVVGLGNDPRDFRDQKIMMKCFFNPESEDENQYAEVFVNLDLQEKILEFHEKDPDYRRPLIRALTTGSK